VSDRKIALLRVGLFALVLVALFVTWRVTGVDVSAESIRDWGEDLGPTAWLAFVPVAVALNCAFVGQVPIVCGAAGLLFGIPVGTVLAIVAVASAAGVQNVLGRRFVGERAQRLLGARGKALDELLERRGFAAVVYVRLIPLIPFILVNYATGVTRLRPLTLAAGSAVGMAPRIYAYTALGGSLHDLGSTQGLIAIGLIAAAAAVGVGRILRAVVVQRRLAA
jgi:uncharacterized membrane protein YdjX (TVP38/TMEM64 family)